MGGGQGGEAWIYERNELLLRLEQYHIEIEESRALAALQQRRALLQDFPSRTDPESLSTTHNTHSTHRELNPSGDSHSPVTDASISSASLPHTGSHGANDKVRQLNLLAKHN